MPLRHVASGFSWTFYSFRARARWLALITVGWPLLALVLVVVIPKFMQWIGSLRPGM